MPYPTDILSTRAIVKHGSYAVIPPDGLVNNVVPGIEGCRVSIVASPKMGASFVQYVIEAPQNAGTTRVFGDQENIETFLYVVSGHGTLRAAGKEYDAPQGAYLYSPAGVGLEFRNTCDQPMKVLLYKQVFLPLEGAARPEVCFGNVNDIPYREYDGMANVFIKDLLPVEQRLVKGQFPGLAVEVEKDVLLVAFRQIHPLSSLSVSPSPRAMPANSRAARGITASSKSKARLWWGAVMPPPSSRKVALPPRFCTRSIMKVTFSPAPMSLAATTSRMPGSSRARRAANSASSGSQATVIDRPRISCSIRHWYMSAAARQTRRALSSM